jgi:hypothetical protein
MWPIWFLPGKWPDCMLLGFLLAFGMLIIADVFWVFVG